LRPEIDGLRVCIVADRFLNVGGSETQILTWARRLVELGVDPLVLARRMNGHMDNPNALAPGRVVRLRSYCPSLIPRHDRWFLKGLGILSYAFAVRRALVKYRRDYAVAHYSGGGLVTGLTAPIAKRLGKGVVCHVSSLSGTEVGSLRRGPYRSAFPILRRLYSKVDVFHANGGAVRQGLLDDGFARDQIVTIPNMVDTARFRPARAGEREILRRRLGLPGGTVVLYSGRLLPQKGVGTLLRAWRVIVGRIPGATLVFLGDGPERRALERDASSWGIGGSVRFAGLVDNVEEYLRAADLFVFPSEFEAMPNAVLEAMACGLPIVTTAVGSLSDLLEAGRSGLFVPPSSVDALVEGVQELLLEPIRGNALGDNAARVIRERCALSVVESEYLSLYWKALAQPIEVRR
jgi:glycosyltransferase involved in cell wall biosynthesis